MTTFIVEEVENAMEHQDLHIPVFPEEVAGFLNLSPQATVVDCTVGCGGHARMIAERIGAQGRLIGIDRDQESLLAAERELKEYQDRCELIHDDFRNIDKILEQRQITEVDGVLLDLGISSFQLDNPQRGFSLKKEGPLDMRMDRESFISAFDLINSLSEREISLILKNYGEERWHNRIARQIVAKRPVESTQELCEVVLQALPAYYQREKIHPATRTFQAFRIAVNRELEALEIVLNKAPLYLKRGARICVISFHSLEDRIVKQKFRSLAKLQNFKLIVKKPVRPTEEEISRNPRARSARLRVAEKI